MRVSIIVHSVLIAICLPIFLKGSIWMSHGAISNPSRRKFSKMYRILLAICMLVFANGWGPGAFDVQLLFESARLRGLVEIVWYLLAWFCLVSSIFLYQPELKIATLVFVAPALLVATLFSIPDLEMIFTDKDTTLEPMSKHNISANSRVGFYFFNHGLPGYQGPIKRMEVDVLPGIFLAHGYKRCSLDDIPKN